VQLWTWRYLAGIKGDDAPVYVVSQP